MNLWRRKNFLPASGAALGIAIVSVALELVIKSHLAPTPAPPRIADFATLKDAWLALPDTHSSFADLGAKASFKRGEVDIAADGSQVGNRDADRWALLLVSVAVQRYPKANHCVVNLAYICFSNAGNCRLDYDKQHQTLAVEDSGRDPAYRRRFRNVSLDVIYKVVLQDPQQHDFDFDELPGYGCPKQDLPYQKPLPGPTL